MGRRDTQHNDIQQNGTQNKGVIWDIQLNDTQHKTFVLSVAFYLLICQMLLCGVSLC